MIQEEEICYPKQQIDKIKEEALVRINYSISLVQDAYEELLDLKRDIENEL